MAYYPKSEKERIIHRLKIARGHLSKVVDRIESEEPCFDTIHQLKAIQSSLKGVDLLIAEHHLRNCLKGQLKVKNGKDMDEIMVLLKKYHTM